MSVTARLPRTISQIGYAMITGTDPSTGKDTDGPVKLLPHIAGGREFSADPQGDTFSVWADGLEIYAENNDTHILEKENFPVVIEHLLFDKK